MLNFFSPLFENNIQLLNEFSKYLNTNPKDLIWDSTVGLNSRVPTILVPLNKKIAKEVFGYPPAVVSFHVTNHEGFDSLQKVQKKSNAVSTVNDINPTSTFLSHGVRKNGLIVKLTIRPLLIYGKDVYSYPDSYGQRWVQLKKLYMQGDFPGKTTIQKNYLHFSIDVLVDVFKQFHPTDILKVEYTPEFLKNITDDLFKINKRKSNSFYVYYKKAVMDNLIKNKDQFRSLGKRFSSSQVNRIIKAEGGGTKIEIHQSNYNEIVGEDIRIRKVFFPAKRIEAEGDELYKKWIKKYGSKYEHEIVSEENLANVILQKQLSPEEQDSINRSYSPKKEIKSADLEKSMDAFKKWLDKKTEFTGKVNDPEVL